MKKYQQCVTLLIIVLCLHLQVGCGASQELKEENKVNIYAIDEGKIFTDFYYSASAFESGYAYMIGINTDGDMIINHLNYGLGRTDICIPLTQKKYKELVQIIEEYDIVSWDGFGKDSINVLDGGGFSLEILWNDGASISATSQYPYPDNFEEVDRAIKGFFNYYLDWKKANNIE